MRYFNVPEQLEPYVMKLCLDTNETFDDILILLKDEEGVFIDPEKGRELKFINGTTTNFLFTVCFKATERRMKILITKITLHLHREDRFYITSVKHATGITFNLF